MRFGRLIGVKLKIHPLLLVLAVVYFWLGLGLEVLLVLAAVLLHELAHLVAARSLKVTVQEVEIFDDFFRVCAEEKVDVIEVSGKPAVKYLDMLHKAGVKVMHKVGAVRHALNIEKYGYDAVIAAGIEEGGHPLNDDVTTTVLVPRIVESVKIPVISTGGIADGRGLAAALSLGAEGVLMATRFIATKECAVHPDIWEELIRRQENDTTLICKSIGLQGRALKNQLAQQILDLESQGAGLAEMIPLLSGQKVKAAWQNGDVDNAAFMVGQSIGLIKEVTTCKELIESMVEEARTIFAKNLARF
jgi:NAD(P)H-dependent flavin oxidoreductase YrpB (nitropropane dioxygenase family)